MGAGVPERDHRDTDGLVLAEFGPAVSTATLRRRSLEVMSFALDTHPAAIALSCMPGAECCVRSVPV